MQLNDDIMRYLFEILSHYEWGVIVLIRFKATCSKYYYSQYLNKLIYKNKHYVNIQHDLDIGYFCSKINTHESRIRNFIDTKESNIFLHQCSISGCNINATKNIYDMQLPYDFLPIMFNYIDYIKGRIEKKYLIIDEYNFPVGIKLGIIKAALEYEE